MLKVKVKKLNEAAEIPKYMTKGSACFDITITNILKDKNNILVETGLSFEIPDGYKLVIVPRSSFSNKNWVLANSPAQIDSDFRGEVILKFQPLEGIATFPYKVGERIAQGYIEKVIKVDFEEVEELSSTDRGEGGFGSTGN